MTKRKTKKHLFAFMKSIWFYPILLFICLILFTLFQISGSSTGEYTDILYGEKAKDQHLIFGDPREIRSDEWMVATQATIAQKESGFPRVNTNFGNGIDMSLISDAPYREWSTLFRPQNFSFFLMPLENAFAFKWWFLIISLALAAYFLSLYLIKNTSFAILVSLLTACSPFVFWWYQSGTILPITYALLIILLSMSMIDRTPIRILGKTINSRYSTALKVSALSYVLIAFALMLYPPFQIPLIIVGGFFIAGYLLNVARGKSLKEHLYLLLPFVCAIALTGAVCATFIATRLDTVQTISNTAYPGKRSVPSGGYNIDRLMANYLQPELINNNRQDRYYSNQSETSSFILLPVFFVIPLIYILGYIYHKKKRVDWIIAGLLASVLILLSHLFIPMASPVAKLFFLDLVPTERAIIGLGIVAILIVIYISKLYATEIKLNRHTRIGIILYATAFFLIAVASGLHIHELYPEFIVSKKILVLYAFIVYAGMTLILLGKKQLGVALLALFSLYSVYQIHPLYNGMGPIYNSKISTAIREVSKTDDVWGVAEDIRFENIPQISGRKAITGVSFYPDVKFWDNYSETSKQSIYNRFAHIVFDKKTDHSVLLVQDDVFVVSTSCKRKIMQYVDFMLSNSPINDSCLELQKEIAYPKMTFYIYKVSHMCNAQCKTAN